MIFCFVKYFIAKIRGANKRCKIEHPDERIHRILSALGLGPDLAAFHKLINHNRNSFTSNQLSGNKDDSVESMGGYEGEYSHLISATEVLYDKGILNQEEGNELRAVFRSFGSLVMQDCSPTREAGFVK